MDAVIKVVARYITGGSVATARFFVLFVTVMGMLIAWHWVLLVNQAPQIYIGSQEVQVPINQL